ncbi:MAG TPA: heparan-alpha-glucosaminide N-acetyltransferase domain-containing protein [Clostridia bacterium]|nr:heparan-alpha-glucosaminide N-acetyltransferase domain-containing protein [Clostridia bacterium]
MLTVHNPASGTAGELDLAEVQGGSFRVTKRIDSVDLLRGIVMVIMALDHTRDFLTYLRFPPEDTSQTYGVLFFTRWITHFCAPTFFFLAGTGAFLSASRGKPISGLSTFLWKRGLWFMLLEVTLIAFAWSFVPVLPLGLVIWQLGLCMVCMAAIVRLPLPWIAIFGIATVALHNTLDTLTPAAFGKLGWIWHLVHQPGMIQVAEYKGQPVGFFSMYVLVPWVGVMAAGYAFGAVLRKPTEQRRRLLLLMGGTMTMLFVVLRLANWYGNPPAETTFIPWAAGPFHPQATLEATLISFFNVTKYPPSLQFLLMTLGPAIMALAWFDRFNFKSLAGRFGEKLLVFGRVPFFFYVLHLFAIHLFAIVAALAYHQPVKWLLWGGFLLNPMPSGYGHSLPFIYAAWILIVFALYFPCKWFADVKQRRRDWWLSYM